MPKKYTDPDEVILRRTNRFIECYNSNTLVENKLLAYATAIAKPVGNKMVADFSISDLKGYEGINHKTLYQKAKEMERSAMKKFYTISHATPDNPYAFLSFNLVDTFAYNKGKVHVLFTEGAKKYVFDQSEAFTTEEVKRLFKFKKNATYRLYELLSTKRYLLASAPSVKKEFDLADLKMQLGLINISDTDQDAIAKKLRRTPTARELLEYYPDKEPYKQWFDFSLYILQPAQEEFHKCHNDISFDFEPVRKGIGGKVVAVKFTIFRDDSIVPEATPNISEQTSADVLSLEVMKIMKDEPITLVDINKLLEASNNNTQEIERIYKLAKKQPDISNLIGWMISAIKNHYQDPIPSAKNQSPQKAKENADILEEAHTFNDLESFSRLLNTIGENFLRVYSFYNYKFDTFNPSIQTQLITILTNFITKLKGFEADYNLIEVAVSQLLNYNIKAFFEITKKIKDSNQLKEFEAFLLKEAASYN